MYDLEPIDLPIEQKTIRQLAVGSGNLAMVVDNPRDRTWEAAVYDEIEYRRLLSRQLDDDVHKIFIDPFGAHVLISLVSGENYHCYIGGKKDEHTSALRAIRCAQLSNTVIESVGWNKFDASGSVLLGDTSGHIHEAKFEPHGCTRRRLAYNLEMECAVTSIEVEKMEKGNGLLVIATASSSHLSRLLQFTGGATLEALFTNCRQPFLREMPGTESSLHLFREALNKPPAVFAWCTEKGILHGRMNLALDSVFSSEAVLSFEDSMYGDRGLMISKHHFYVLTADKLRVIAQPPGLGWPGSGPSEKVTLADTEQKTVWSTKFPPGINNEARGIVQDLSKGHRYVFTKKTVYELAEAYASDSIHPTWKSFLERAMDPKERDREMYFTVAAELCKDDPERTARVQAAKGDYFFDIGEYGRAAKVYSMTQRPFEEIAIKFIKQGQEDELLGFVQFKLQEVQNKKRTFHESATQLCCLATWIVQLHLSQMNKLNTEDKADEYAEAQEEFRLFVEAHLNILDKVTICEMIATSARPEEFLFFIELLQDYQRLIAQYMTHNKPDKALECLIRHCTQERDEELWYQFSPRLMEHAPHTLVSGWMVQPKGKSFLKPPRLIPALMKYDMKYNPPGVQKNQAIRYLQWLVEEQGNKDTAIHNMLLSLYAKQDDDEDLLRFLMQQQDDTYYDLKYALRLCLTEQKHRACVHIYTALSLYEDAVKFALKTGDIELAKKVADKSDEDRTGIRKKLWIYIAQHVIKHEPNGDKAAIAMLPQCSVLELEDILPYFPDFMFIQDFKQEIEESLGAYGKKTERLKTCMDKVTHDAQLIQQNIEDHKRGSLFLDEAMKCSACRKLALTESFIAFHACRHRFHERCLTRELLALMHTAARCDASEAFKLKKKIHVLEQYSQARDGAAPKDVEDEALEFLQRECPYCGSMKIAEVALPFIADKEAEAQSWL